MEAIKEEPINCADLDKPAKIISLPKYRERILLSRRRIRRFCLLKDRRVYAEGLFTWRRKGNDIETVVETRD